MRRDSLLGALLIGLLVVGPVAGARAQDPAASPVAGANPVEFVWQVTGGNKPFSLVLDIVIDPAGNLWIVDGNNDQFQIYSPDGTFLEAWTTGEAGDHPYQIAFDSEGNIYVLDAANARIKKFDTNRVLVGQWGSLGREDGQFINPQGFVIDAGGNIYVSDDVRRVQVFDTTGVFIRSWGEPGSGAGQLLGTSFMSVDPDGNLLIAENHNHRVQRFSPDGTSLGIYGGTVGSGDGQLMTPQDASGDAAGNVYITDDENYRVQVFRKDGSYLAQWGTQGTEPGQFSYVAGLTLDGQGNVYVADIGNSRVQKFRLLPPLAPEATPTA